MYTRADVSLEDRLEIFSQYWRFGDDYGFVTRLAEEWGVSRRFVYDLAERMREAVDWHRPGRKPVDTSGEEIDRLTMRVRQLQSEIDTLKGQLEIERRDREERRFRLLCELAMAPVSEDKIARCLGAESGREPSAGWVHGQIELAGEAALRLMQREEVRESLEEAALDELFAGKKPILTAVEPSSMMMLVPEAAADRQGETWGNVLEQYPNLRLAISDLGSGLLKGVDLRGGIDHQADLFHFKRNLRREVRRLETRCYEAIAALDVARKMIDRPRLLSSARIQAQIEWREQAAELDRTLIAFDWLELIVGYVEEQLEPFDRRNQRLRSYDDAQQAIEDALEYLAGIEELRVDGVISTIEGARDRLFTFLELLETRLGLIEVRWKKLTGSREALMSAIARVWYWRSRAGRSEANQRQYLIALAGLEFWDRRSENLAEVIAQAFEVLDAVVRASSAVECINSILRPFISVKKRLNQRFLALVAFYWNMHPIPGRGGRTPFEENGVDLGSDDCVELIEREIRLMAKSAAAVN